jgi:hypothetical protein
MGYQSSRLAGYIDSHGNSIYTAIPLRLSLLLTELLLATKSTIFALPTCSPPPISLYSHCHLTEQTLPQRTQGPPAGFTSLPKIRDLTLYGAGTTLQTDLQSQVQ